jgi:hypothetical protein
VLPKIEVEAVCAAYIDVDVYRNNSFPDPEVDIAVLDIRAFSGHEPQLFRQLGKQVQAAA